MAAGMVNVERSWYGVDGGGEGRWKAFCVAKEILVLGYDCFFRCVY